MSVPLPLPRSASRGPAGRSPDVAGLLALVWRHRMALIVSSLAAGLVALGIAFLLPRWYRATAVILPPEDTDTMTSLTFDQRALTRLPALGLIGDYFTPADVFRAELRSRTLQEEVADRFDLAHVYKTKSREKTLRALKSHYDVRLSADGTIAVSVEDKDPRRAADMTMAFLAALDHYNIEKRNSQAHRTRMFLERRVQETDSLLRASEQALKAYEEEHHTVTPPTSGTGDAQAAADLLGRKTMLEVRLGVLRTYLREDNEEVVQVRQELEQLNARIAAVPALQSDLVRMIRDTKVYEQLYLLLTSELERSRIRETMDTPTVQILDPAVPPERHSRPRRALIAIGASLIALFGSIGYLTWREGSGTGNRAVSSGMEPATVPRAPSPPPTIQ